MLRQMSFDEPTQIYTSVDGWVMRRESGPNPKGPNYAGINGVWVLRDPTSAYVDHDKYRHDIEGRCGLSLR